MELISLQLDQDYLECCVLQPDEQAMNDWLKVFGVVADPWPEDMPVLRCHVPGMLPRPMNDDEEQQLMVALLAAADLMENVRQGKNIAFNAGQMDEGKIPCARQAGGDKFAWRTIEISGDMMIQYPAPALEDELAARRLRRLPVSGAEVYVAVRRLPMPLDDLAKGVPTVMMLIDQEGHLLANPMVGNYESDYGDLAGEYLSYVEENGRPRRILAADPRAFCLLSELAAQLSTPIERTNSLSMINQAMENIMMILKSMAMGREEIDAELEEKYLNSERMGVYFPWQKAIAYEQMPELAFRHLEELGRSIPDKKENFMIRVTCPENEAFWLYLMVVKDGTLRHIDKELRTVWLDCCEHLSWLEVDGVKYSSNCRKLLGKSMNARIQDALKDGMVLEYVFDPEKPTRLRLEVMGTLEMPARREKVDLLAQNFMPKYRCVRCGRRAERVSRLNGGPLVESVYCKDCAMELEEDSLPLMNSPRTGMCCYGAWMDDLDDWDDDDE